MTLTEWANRWGIPPQAITELAGIPAIQTVAFDDPPHSESHVQAKVRLEAARKGVHLWRNNSGAGSVVDPKKLCPRCRPLARTFIRWGLGNDSEKLNGVVKSPDLVGWRKRLITPDMVGSVFAQYTDRECKATGWKFSPNDERDCAQLRWRAMVLSAGGDSAVVTGEGSL